MLSVLLCSEFELSAFENTLSSAVLPSLPQAVKASKNAIIRNIAESFFIWFTSEINLFNHIDEFLLRFVTLFSKKVEQKLNFFDFYDFLSNWCRHLGQVTVIFPLPRGTRRRD